MTFSKLFCEDFVEEERNDMTQTFTDIVRFYVNKRKEELFPYIYFSLFVKMRVFASWHLEVSRTSNYPPFDYSLFHNAFSMSVLML